MISLAGLFGVVIIALIVLKALSAVVNSGLNRSRRQVPPTAQAPPPISQVRQSPEVVPGAVPRFEPAGSGSILAPALIFLAALAGALLLGVFGLVATSRQVVSEQFEADIRQAAAEEMRQSAGEVRRSLRMAADTLKEELGDLRDELPIQQLTPGDSANVAEPAESVDEQGQPDGEPLPGEGENAVDIPIDATEQPDTTEGEPEVVVLKLSEELIQKLMGAGGDEALRTLESVLPDGVGSQYALIPLPAAVGPTVDPAVRGVITNNRITALLDAVGNLFLPPPSTAIPPSTPDVPAEPTVATKPDNDPSENSDFSAATPSILRPFWMDASKRPAGTMIVESEFYPMGEDPNLHLTDLIAARILDKASERRTEINPSASIPNALFAVKPTDRALEILIVDRYDQSELLEVGGDNMVMQRSTALIQVPDAVVDTVDNGFRAVVQENRAYTAGIVVLGLSVVVFLLSWTVRLLQRRSLFSRMMGILVTIGLMLPLTVAVFAVVGQAMSTECVEYPWQALPAPVELDIEEAV